MTTSQDALTREGAGLKVLGAFGVVGLAVAALTLHRSRGRTRQPEAEGRRAALVTYLREHLAGADAAIQVVDRLKHTHKATTEATLFVSLHRQFVEDRTVVTTLLADLGVSPRSIKRLAGHAAGTVLKAAAGGKRGELTLFRTLEALAIGVQGKRCMWRAAQAIAPPLRAPGHRNFVELESHAVDQWEAIEQCRRSLVRPTFTI